jgi:multidrug efflux system membrane fusion protein
MNLARCVALNKSYARIAFCLTFSLGLMSAGCSKQAAGQSKGAQTPNVTVGVPVRMPIVEWDEYVGRLTAVETVEVRARVGGYLATTNFVEGQLVKAGDILMVVDQRPFLAEVNRFEATHAASEAQLVQAKSAATQAEAEKKRSDIRRELAQKMLNRTNQLREKNAVPIEESEVREAELAQAESDVAVAVTKIDAAQSAIVAAKAAVGIAQANLDLAKLNLQYTEVRAPISGRISHNLVTKGNLVSGGTNDSTLLTTIVSVDPIHCYFDADEQAFLRYNKLAREGAGSNLREVKIPVYLALANERDGFPHWGHTDFLENRLDEQTGTIRGRAILPNKNMELTPGLFARVRIPGSPRYDAILIPDRAIATDLAEKYVLVIDGENKVRRQVVTLGPISHGLRVIRSGLKGDEQVVLSGQQKARPGMEANVKVDKITPGKELLPDQYDPVPEEKWLTPKRHTSANVMSPAANAATQAVEKQPNPTTGGR